MATTKQILAEYIETISKQVIDTFGGSYQTYETLGQTWRQQMKYSSKIESFIIDQTKLFLRLMSSRYQHNFNLLYNVSCGIGDYLSKYLVKKSADLTRKQVAEKIVNDIFLESALFVAHFRTTYRKPIDMSNASYVASNPGIVAMYVSIQKHR